MPKKELEKYETSNKTKIEKKIILPNARIDFRRYKNKS